jgi:cob(I)alamin adenosyltransferase
MKIYTKTGDNGETSYIGGRVSKASEMVDVLGNLDELNASLGLTIAQSTKPKRPKSKPSVLSFDSTIISIQSTLFDIGAVVASPSPVLKSSTLAKILPAKTLELEKQIDETEATLPALQNFILPGGAPTGASLHVARAICRRAERSIVKLISSIDFKSDIQEAYQQNLKDTQKYLNRLSDYLFVLARFVNQAEGAPERTWVGSEHTKLKI